MSRLEIQAPYLGKYSLNITHTMKGLHWYIHEKDDDINEPLVRIVMHVRKIGN